MLLLVLSNCRFLTNQITQLASLYSKEILATRFTNDPAADSEDEDTDSIKQSPKKPVKKEPEKKQPAKGKKAPLKKKQNNKKKSKHKSDSSDSDDSETESETETSTIESTVSDTETSSSTSTHSTESDSDTDTEERIMDSKSKNTTLVASRSYNDEDFAMAKEVKIVNEVFDCLSSLVVKSYLRHKTRSLNHFIVKGMLTGGHDWARGPAPTQVRSYMLELLLDLAQVHYQAELVAKNFVKQFFCSVQERLGELFLEHLSYIPRIGDNGVLQLEIEVDFLNIVLRNYETSRSKDLFKRVKSNLKSASSVTIKDKGSTVSNRKKLRDEIIQQMLDKSRLQFSCFELPDKV
jgi:hypothetical protein